MITLRKATAQDMRAIRTLVYQAGINPTGLHWPRFTVAVNAQGEVIGCAQLKPHAGQILELASLVTHPGWRGKGVARQLIEHCQAQVEPPLYLMCRSGLGSFYEKFGFSRLEPVEMPAYFQRIHRLFTLLARIRPGRESLLVMRWNKAVD